MNLEEAKTLLKDSIRYELRDHAFGDMEVTWEKDGEVIATGYFGSVSDSVTVGDNPPVMFDGDDAHSLMSCGTLGGVGRNDETGPDDFVQGRVMPGLTAESVLEEICQRPT